jgi:NADH-quinone oxidoreductase subunit N
MYITAYFSVFVKCLLFLIFLKIAVHFNCDALAAQFSIISLAVGCFMSINQSEIKRLLAYSSIVHVGFLLMGDTASSLVYLTTYILSSLAIFAVLLNAEVAGSEIIYFNDLRYIRGSYLNTATLVVAMASSAGLPPFAGFYGKFLV